MDKWKVALLIPAGQRPQFILGLAPSDLDVTWVDLDLPNEDKLPLCQEADAVIAAPPWFSADLLKDCPKVKLVQTLTSGYNRLDIQGIIDLGVPVANNSGINAATMAEHTIGVMIALCRRLVEMHLSVKEGRWQGHIDPSNLTEINGKVIGIIGFGFAGQAVARRLRGFDVRTIYHTTSEVNGDVREELGAEPTSLELLLQESDFVTLHVPLTPLTRGMIGELQLAMMKPSSFLINTSRGPVVDQGALYQVLKEGGIAGAGLDVFEMEPLVADNPLLELKSIVLTPHMAGSTA
ncbi:MAG: hypothetical protein J4G01_01025, partial [Dehalococcoidia bacterium]|nr:hypothetical protein [Dehalococcoidia bacterium]